MSFIDFESGTAKERARQEIREARAELLKQAELRFHNRQEEEIKKKLRGDDDWMLPAVAKKIQHSDHSSASKSKKSKKEKKSKKSKKEKKKKHRKRNSSTSEDSDTSCSSGDDRKIKRKHRKSSSEEWVESNPNQTTSSELKPYTVATRVERDDWMSGMLIPTFSSKKETDPKKDVRNNIDSYDPKLSSRELNPFWKNGGTGLPSFKKPVDDSDDENQQRSLKSKESNTQTRGNWRKKSAANTKEHRSKSRSPDASSKRHRSPEWGRKARQSSPKRKELSSASSSRSCSPTTNHEPKPELKTRANDFMTDQQMNELGAKIIKAEIMGDSALIEKLKNKLETARNYRATHKHELVASKTSTSTAMAQREDVLLTATNSQGFSKPLKKHTPVAATDPWGGKRGNKNGKKVKVETHSGGDRIRYFADDDKYNLKEMFENEKFTSANDQDEQFMNIASKHKNPNDDLEDIFAEKVRKGLNDTDLDHKDQARAIRQHHEITKTLDTCDKCMDSPKMEKQLIVSMGTNVYLSLPWHEGLQTGHCQIIPIQHVACSTNLDEDVWREIIDFQKAVTKMFRSRGLDVIFFETARYLHKRPHLAIQCVPNRNFELAPFYFKKAIQESEREWSTNKQLVSLREKDLRRSIPKGLPYFWVQFGTDSGFAHVIEEQDRFPNNFAQEIIGGLLNLDVRTWRKLRKEQNPIVKVKQFADWWKPFDITDNM